MAVLKEWSCAAHGEFEAFDAVCPFGCSARFVKREIRTAPAIRHTGTRNSDNLTQQLANDFNLTDLSTKDGESVMTNMRKRQWANAQVPSSWAAVPHAADGWSQRGEAAAKFNPQSVGLAAAAAMKEVGGRVTVDTARGAQAIPKPTPDIIKDGKGRPLSYKAALPEVD